MGQVPVRWGEGNWPPEDLLVTVWLLRVSAGSICVVGTALAWTSP